MVEYLWGHKQAGRQAGTFLVRGGDGCIEKSPAIVHFFFLAHSTYIRYYHGIGWCLVVAAFSSIELLFFFPPCLCMYFSCLHTSDICS